jgi:hypothetical protein
LISTTQSQKPAYPPYPSVLRLLHENGLPDSELSKIPTTGPKGRLLKGDVLAYLGSVKASYPATQAQRIAQLSHLDLNNIKLSPASQRPTELAPVAEETVSTPALPPPAETSVAVPISLSSVLSVQKRIQDCLGITVPLSTFIERAADIANEELPRWPLAAPSIDELYDEILGASPITTSRGHYIPEVNAVPAPPAAVSVSSSSSFSSPDIIDFLSDKIGGKSTASALTSVIKPITAGSSMNTFSLTVPARDERRAKAFLDRIKTVLQADPGRLVL